MNYKLVEKTPSSPKFITRNTISKKKPETAEAPYRVLENFDRKTGFVDIERMKQRIEFYKT
jgi:hypothetical protein